MLEWDTTLCDARGSGLSGNLPGNLYRHCSKAPEDAIPMPLSEVIGYILHEAIGTWSTKLSLEGFLRFNKFTSLVCLVSAFNLVF